MAGSQERGHHEPRTKPEPEPRHREAPSEEREPKAKAAKNRRNERKKTDKIEGGSNEGRRKQEDHRPGGTTLLISAFFFLTAALTNVLSNNATAVLLTPIAISASAVAGIDPAVLVFTVIYAANCSFATPVAYQTNLLVMAPGHYQFRDFVLIGVPLIILLWIVYTLVAPIYFGAVGLM